MLPLSGKFGKEAPPGMLPLSRTYGKERPSACSLCPGIMARKRHPACSLCPGLMARSAPQLAPFVQDLWQGNCRFLPKTADSMSADSMSAGFHVCRIPCLQDSMSAGFPRFSADSPSNLQKLGRKYIESAETRSKRHRIYRN